MAPPTEDSVAQRVRRQVLQTTHGRIRDLDVEEVQGGVILRGRASTQHLRQLALHAALQVITGESVQSRITVA